MAMSNDTTNDSIISESEPSAIWDNNKSNPRQDIADAIREAKRNVGFAYEISSPLPQPESASTPPASA